MTTDEFTREILELVEDLGRHGMSNYMILSALRHLAYRSEPTQVNKRVQAVKIYRAQTGAMLWEAKDYVDSHPEYVDAVVPSP